MPHSNACWGLARRIQIPPFLSFKARPRNSSSRQVPLLHHSPGASSPGTCPRGRRTLCSPRWRSWGCGSPAQGGIRGSGSEAAAKLRGPRCRGAEGAAQATSSFLPAPSRRRTATGKPTPAATCHANTHVSCKYASACVPTARKLPKLLRSACCPCSFSSSRQRDRSTPVSRSTWETWHYRGLQD